MPAAISTETTPASKLARAPKITRDRTSRPFSSVPIQCSADGALRIAVQDVAIGSYGRDQRRQHGDADEHHDDRQAGDRDRPVQEAPQRQPRRALVHRDGDVAPRCTLPLCGEVGPRAGATTETCACASRVADRDLSP